MIQNQSESSKLQDAATCLPSCMKLIGIVHLLCARHSCQCFIWINSLIHHTIPIKQMLLSFTLQRTTQAQRDKYFYNNSYPRPLKASQPSDVGCLFPCLISTTNHPLGNALTGRSQVIMFSESWNHSCVCHLKEHKSYVICILLEML